LLDVLILEGDPVISLDLADAALAVDPAARVRVLERAEPVCAERWTHAFLRAGPGVARLARRLAAEGARVFLIGADRLPRELAGTSRVTAVPFPFTADQLTAFLTDPDPDRPAAA
jgi:hypothetical protein